MGVMAVVMACMVMVVALLTLHHRAIGHHVAASGGTAMAVATCAVRDRTVRHHMAPCRGGRMPVACVVKVLAVGSRHGVLQFLFAV